MYSSIISAPIVMDRFTSIRLSQTLMIEPESLTESSENCAGVSEGY
ncbi:hypothetical protein J525_3595 [Acinetobacter sp. 21871]|nr:hypothetical protein J525_3595 [Acinetobacter sp. 21871]EXR58405.1 hypothetical protein J678_3715 [Acinetobacter sp. 1424608]